MHEKYFTLSERFSFVFTRVFMELRSADETLPLLVSQRVWNGPL